jgi:conjugal transfer ATP-binding protein TraC
VKATSPNVKTKPTSSFVNLDTYTREDHLIVSKADGDKTYIGRVYLMSPLAGGGGEFSTVVQHIIKSAPDDTVIQVSLVCEPDYEAEHIFAKGKSAGGPLVTELIKRQCKLLKNAVKFAWQPDIPSLNIRSVIVSLGSPVKSLSDEVTENAKQQHAELLGNLRGSGFHDARPISAEELVGIYQKYSNIYQPIKPVKLDEIIDLKHQIYGPDQVFDFSDRRVGSFAEDVFCAAITVKSFPVKPFHGLMNLVSGAPFNSGSALDGGGARVRTPFILTTTVRVAHQRREWGRVDKAIKSRSVVQNFPFKLGNEDPATKLADLLTIKKQCGDEENKFVYVSTTAFLFGKTKDEAIEAADSIKGTLNKLGFDARHVLDNALVRWAQALPLNFAPKIADLLACEGLMSAASACCLLPVYGDNLGNTDRNAPNTGAAFVTRRSQVHYFDLWRSNSNYNGLIAACPGSGKSVAAQYLVEVQLAEGTNVVYLDNGRSLKKFCHSVDGEYNEFGTSGFKPSLNPFTGLTDDEFDEQTETITALFLLMSYEGEKPEVGSRIAMNEAVKAAWGQKGAEAEIPTVIAALQSIVNSGVESSIRTQVVQAAANLVPRLKAFIESPSRGQYFRGQGTLNPRKQFTVFELGGLGDDEHLKKCVLFFVLNLLLSRIKQIVGRKMIIVDEAHDLLKDPSAGDVMEGLYLKGRKEKVAMWVIVQSLIKLKEMHAGPVILNQSPWKLILGQFPEEIDEVIDKKILTAFKDDPYFHKAIRSVRTEKGVFSEILVMSSTSYEVVRLYVDKFTATLFSSEDNARDEVFAMMEGGMSASDAVNKLLGDNRDSRQKHIKVFLDQLHRYHDLTPGEIVNEIKEAMLS